MLRATTRPVMTACAKWNGAGLIFIAKFLLFLQARYGGIKEGFNVQSYGRIMEYSAGVNQEHLFCLEMKDR